MSGDDVCLKHSGMCAKIKNLEDDVKNLWAKWDSIQKLLVGTLVSATLSFLGVIFLLLRLK